METVLLYPLGHIPGKFPAYLQGMETRGSKWRESLYRIGSQPTYKEWKQIVEPEAPPEPPGSQPTYKEWKPPATMSQKRA